MKWVTKDYKGNQQVWYSEDVIEKIKENVIWLIALSNDTDYANPNYLGGIGLLQHNLRVTANEILNFINEVENESTEDKCINPDLSEQA